MLEAAAALATVLAEENAALAVMDIPRANALLATKIAATDRLVLAMRPPVAPLPAQGRAQAGQLRDLAAQNKILLERAMVAQNRVMACIARAVPKAMAQGGPYGAGGGQSRPRNMPAVAFSARA